MTTATQTRTPAADIFELDQAYDIHLDIPGVNEDDVNVEVDRNRLRIVADHYARSFTLGHGIDRDQVTASVRDGVLTVTIAKSAAAQKRQIPVNRSNFAPGDRCHG